MLNNELLSYLDNEVKAAEFESACGDGNDPRVAKSLRAVVKLHSGIGLNNRCVICAHGNKCETIQIIEKELL
jgi:hypothetical protein